MPGCPVLAPLPGTQMPSRGFAGSRGTAGAHISGPSTHLFFGVQEAAKPSPGQEGLLRVHPSELQPAPLWRTGGHHGTIPFLLSSSLHIKKQKWGWALPGNHGVWCSVSRQETSQGSCDWLWDFSPSLFSSRY